MDTSKENASVAGDSGGGGGGGGHASIASGEKAPAPAPSAATSAAPTPSDAKPPVSAPSGAVQGSTSTRSELSSSPNEHNKTKSTVSHEGGRSTTASSHGAAGSPRATRRERSTAGSASHESSGAADGPSESRKNSEPTTGRARNAATNERGGSSQSSGTVSSPKPPRAAKVAARVVVASDEHSSSLRARKGRGRDDESTNSSRSGRGTGGSAAGGGAAVGGGSSSTSSSRSERTSNTAGRSSRSDRERTSHAHSTSSSLSSPAMDAMKRTANSSGRMPGGGGSAGAVSSRGMGGAGQPKVSNGRGPLLSSGMVATVSTVGGLGHVAPNSSSSLGGVGGPGPTSVSTANVTSVAVDGLSGTAYTSRQGTRCVFIGDVHGKLTRINSLIHKAHAAFAVVTGSFGFYDATSHASLSESQLRAAAIAHESNASERKRIAALSDRELREAIRGDAGKLSEFTLFVRGERKFVAPVFVVWGAHEDMSVVERLRTGAQRIDQLSLVHESATHLLPGDIRLFGLGGEVVPERLFDHGDCDGSVSVMGGQGGHMWVTMMQLGALLQSADTLHDTRETRVLVTHDSTAHSALLALLAVHLRADYTVSRQGATPQHCSVVRDSDLEPLAGRVSASLAAVRDVYAQAEPHLSALCTEQERVRLERALVLIDQNATEPCAFASSPMFHLRVPNSDAGHFVLSLDSRGRATLHIDSEARDLSHRRATLPSAVDDTAGRAPLSTVNHHESGSGRHTGSSALAGTGPHSIFVKSVPVPESEVLALFEHCGPIVSVSTIRPGIWFIDFENSEAFNAALAVSGQKLGGKAVTVEPKKRK